MDQKTSQQIIQETQANFNMISHHFLETRRFLWRDIMAFAPAIDKKAKVLDLACGSGRFAQLAPNPKNYLGVDFSKNLIQGAKRFHPQAKFITANLVSFKTWQTIKKYGPYDFVLAIAFLPHLPLEKQHQFILNQSYQVLKPSGQLLLSVWNLWQRRFWLHHLKQLPQKIKLKSLKSLCVPYKISDGRQVIKTASRYHYAFLPYQLKRFIKKAGFKIKKQQLKGKNFIFLAEKPKEA